MHGRGGGRQERSRVSLPLYAIRPVFSRAAFRRIWESHACMAAMNATGFFKRPLSAVNQRWWEAIRRVGRACESHQKPPITC